MDDPVPPIARPLVFGHYRVLTRPPGGEPHELGRGAMGVTYKATDTNLGSTVALKVINSLQLGSASSRARFSREAKAAAQLSHGNVARVFHLGQEGENSFYAMEFIEGETLEALVRREGPLDIASAVSIGVQICRGLQAAHEKGLLHRDLKPANVMLMREQDERVVKIIDFGLVKQLDMLDSGGNGPGEAGETPETGGGGPAEPALTQGGFCGTPQYASPEQFDFEGTICARSDLYSLGVTLWFLLEGRPPFQGSLAQIFKQLWQKPLPFERLAGARPDLSPELLAVLRRLLAREPEDRPPDAACARHEILFALAQPPEDFMSPGAPPGVHAVHSSVHPSSSTTGAAAPARAPVAEPPRPGDETQLDTALPPASEAVAPANVPAPENTAPLAPVPEHATRPRRRARSLAVAAWLCVAAVVGGTWYALTHHIAGTQTRIDIGMSLAKRALAEGDDDTAASALSRLKADDPGNEFATENLQRLGEKWRNAADALRGTDPAGAAARYAKAAEAGNPQAQFELGLLKETGTPGVRRDLPGALALFRQAAGQGLGDAQVNLGRMYEIGEALDKPDPAQARVWYERAAAQGHALAQTNLGHLYQLGLGVPRDPAKAMDLFHRAAAAGEATAQLDLGGMYQMGEAVSKPDYAQAALWYEKAARQGNAQARNNLGTLYEHGLGTADGQPDFPRAAECYRLAAGQGIATAQLNMGSLYLRGIGVPRDAAQALSWYRLAAAQEEISAQYQLGVLYGTGTGVARDPAQAAEWYRKAAEAGLTPQNDERAVTAIQLRPGEKPDKTGKDTKNGQTPKEKPAVPTGRARGTSLLVASAQMNLALLLWRGDGVPRDEKQAGVWMTRAASLDFAPAQTNLGIFYHEAKGGLARDDAEAVKWWQRASDEGEMQARALLGRACVEGEGLPKDEARGVALLRAAAEAGSTAGQALLGNLYRDGKGGLARDYARARELYKQAAAQGDDDGLHGLGSLYEKGWGVPLDKAEAIRQYTLAARKDNAEARAALERLK